MLTQKDVRDLSTIVADANVRHRCGNCGGVVFATNAAAGDVYCIACGGIDERLLVDAPTFDELFDAYGNLRQFRPKAAVFDAGAHYESVGAAQPLRSSNSAPYRRATYWAERISQWRQNEPPIADDDWQAISHAYIAFTSDGPLGDKKWELSYVLCKDDIRELLRSCDKQLEARNVRTRYVRRYLVSFSFCKPASVSAMYTASSLRCSMHGGS